MKAHVELPDVFQGKTESGFEFKISKERLDDIELIDALETFDREGSGLSDVLNRLLGVEQKKALYDHVRNKDGIAKASAVIPLIVEIIDLCKAGNSSSSSD